MATRSSKNGFGSRFGLRRASSGDISTSNSVRLEEYVEHNGRRPNIRRSRSTSDDGLDDSVVSDFVTAKRSSQLSELARSSSKRSFTTDDLGTAVMPYSAVYGLGNHLSLSSHSKHEFDPTDNTEESEISSTLTDFQTRARNSSLKKKQKERKTRTLTKNFLHHLSAGRQSPTDEESIASADIFAGVGKKPAQNHSGAIEEDESEGDGSISVDDPVLWVSAEKVSKTNDALQNNCSNDDLFNEHATLPTSQGHDEQKLQSDFVAAMSASLPNLGTSFHDLAPMSTLSSCNEIGAENNNGDGDDDDDGSISLDDADLWRPIQLSTKPSHNTAGSGSPQSNSKSCTQERLFSQFSASLPALNFDLSDDSKHKKQSKAAGRKSKIAKSVSTSQKLVPRPGPRSMKSSMELFSASMPNLDFSFSMESQDGDESVYSTGSFRVEDDTFWNSCDSSLDLNASNNKSFVRKGSVDPLSTPDGLPRCACGPANCHCGFTHSHAATVKDGETDKRDEDVQKRHSHKKTHKEGKSLKRSVKAQSSHHPRRDSSSRVRARSSDGLQEGKRVRSRSQDSSPYASTPLESGMLSPKKPASGRTRSTSGDTIEKTPKVRKAHRSHDRENSSRTERKSRITGADIHRSKEPKTKGNDERDASRENSKRRSSSRGKGQTSPQKADRPSASSRDQSSTDESQPTERRARRSTSNGRRRVASSSKIRVSRAGSDDSGKENHSDRRTRSSSRGSTRGKSDHAKEKQRQFAEEKRCETAGESALVSSDSPRRGRPRAMSLRDEVFQEKGATGTAPELKPRERERSRSSGRKRISRRNSDDQLLPILTRVGGGRDAVRVPVRRRRSRSRSSGRNEPVKLASLLSLGGASQQIDFDPEEEEDPLGAPTASVSISQSEAKLHVRT